MNEPGQRLVVTEILFGKHLEPGPAVGGDLVGGHIGWQIIQIHLFRSQRKVKGVEPPRQRRQQPRFQLLQPAFIGRTVPE